MQFVKISLETWKKLDQILKVYDAGGMRPQRQQQQPNPATVVIKNSTGADRSQCEVLGISGVEVLPADDFAEFQSRSAFTGAIPATASHSNGRFAILAEPIPNGEYGRAYISNLAAVQINVTDANHSFADITDATTAKLASVESGPCVILWKESGTGDKWAIVRFGGTGGGAVPDIHVAYVKEAAPADIDISCYLDTNDTGTIISVRCNISPFDAGVQLDKASPELVVDMPIFVRYGAYDGYTGWMCTTPFVEKQDWS